MPTEPGKFLDGAYELDDPESTRSFYRDWAATYEAETLANGYVTPRRCAAALSKHADDESAPLLDLGCGTGLSGLAFNQAGFETIDGSDFSPEMLALAEAKQGVYRKLTLSDIENPIPARAGEYRNIAAVGVFSPGHAPPGMIAEATGLLPRGGCFVFSLNDHALEIPGYEDAVKALENTGEASIEHWEYGDHLPGRGLRAVVCVLRAR